MPAAILNFHGIGRPGRPLEPGEDRFWISIDSFRRILDLVADRPDARPLATLITFDDGNLSDAELGAPELAARGLVATFFPVAGRIGQPGSVSAEDLRGLRRQGHRIGSHGFDHVDWRRIDAAGQVREFDSARDHIGAVIGEPVDEVAIPFGFYDSRVIAALRLRPIAAVHTTDKGVWTGTDWLRPRNCVRADHRPEDIRAILAGRLTPVQTLRRLVSTTRKRRL